MNTDSETTWLTNCVILAHLRLSLATGQIKSKDFTQVLRAYACLSLLAVLDKKLKNAIYRSHSKSHHTEHVAI